MVALALAGCGGTGPPDPAVLERGPHQGFLRPLDGTPGFVEVVTEPATKPGPRGLNYQVAVYFLNRERTAPLQPNPTAVSLEATWPDAAPRETLPLQPLPVAGGVKFVSPPLPTDALPSGTLHAEREGQPITAAL